MGLQMDSPCKFGTDSETFRGRSGKPRLFIKEMVMRNFKSYAGEQRVGPFHKVRVFFFSFLLSASFVYSQTEVVLGSDEKVSFRETKCVIIITFECD